MPTDSGVGAGATSTGRVPPSASVHPPTWRFDYPIFHVECREDWRAWLAENHARERGVWLCTWKPATGRPALPYPAAVEEAICFGWIDSTAASLDDQRRLQLMTPRRPRSGWTRLNRRRVAEQEAIGRMTDAGRRAVEVARANGWWTRMDPVEDLIEPADLGAALDAQPVARVAWDGFPPSARKRMLWWLVTAAKPQTRARRVARIVEDAGAGRRAQG
ncbi:YdeI/OmpD-associated family protein [Egicoccus halophilus]|uniref:YdeI/OmpD-associated family protein n=1 Tax=Egicoccus halophilus TaxID=1670830 RepID=UPI00197AF5C0|nr:YdeI/OmpD-associated family protein [Egicoccus halophilus]